MSAAPLQVTGPGPMIRDAYGSGTVKDKTYRKYPVGQEAGRAAELAKCAVLCEGCHKRAHREARRVEAELRNPHGTHQRYYLGCRCDPCRIAKREYNRRYVAGATT